MKSIRTMLDGVTLEDLREWAGSKIYNRGKEYIPCVYELSRIEDGTLVAWVSGTDEYATWVRHEGQGDFDYDCTCPYDWGPCKHAVAVLLAASGQIRQRKEIPLLDTESDLYLEAFEDDDYDSWQDNEVEDFVPSLSIRSSGKNLPEFDKFLADKSRDELQAMLLELVGEFPEVARKIREKGLLEAGQDKQLIRSLRKEIRKLTAQDAWYDHWKRRGNLPDYAHLEKQLQALLNNGNADAVLELGEELFTRGIDQVERSNDDGMTAEAISACLEIVLHSLPQTVLTPVEQLLWLAERELADQYNLLGDTSKILNNWRYTPLHWREVAAVVRKWLKQLKVPMDSSYSARYQRERVMLLLRNAYRRGEEPDKMISLLEKEADYCQSYESLVEALLDAGEIDRARQWGIRGYQQTLKDAPGIASALQRQLRKLAETEGNLGLVAAYRAEDFFEHPSIEAYVDLRKVAEKMDLWSVVRSAVLDFLQDGKRPTDGDPGKSSWSLPEPEVKRPELGQKFQRISFPNRDMLIEIAILEKRFDDAVMIYHDSVGDRRWNYDVDERLAKAVAVSHPDTALRIWQSIAEGLISQVKPKAYQEAAKYLRQIHTVYEQTKRLAEWNALIIHLRTRHKAKRRLMEVLDGLEKDRKLVD
ncbi:MAG: SWIM zinc finger family protein [Desulfuromusa sp.]